MYFHYPMETWATSLGLHTAILVTSHCIESDLVTNHCWKYAVHAHDEYSNNTALLKSQCQPQGTICLINSRLNLDVTM